MNLQFLTDSVFYEVTSLNDPSTVRLAVIMDMGFSLNACVCYLVLKGAVHQ
jgi:hypothetical protein